MSLEDDINTIQLFERVTWGSPLGRAYQLVLSQMPIPFMDEAKGIQQKVAILKVISEALEAADLSANWEQLVAAKNSRISRLEEALRASWWYDCYYCEVCHITIYDEHGAHERDCIVPSLYPETGEHQRGQDNCRQCVQRWGWQEGVISS